MTAWLRMEGFWKSSCSIPGQAALPGPSCPRPCPGPFLGWRLHPVSGQSVTAFGHPHNEIISSTEIRNLSWSDHYSILPTQKRGWKIWLDHWLLGEEHSHKKGGHSTAMRFYLPTPPRSGPAIAHKYVEVLLSQGKTLEVGLMMPVTCCVWPLVKLITWQKGISFYFGEKKNNIRKQSKVMGADFAKVYRCSERFGKLLVGNV